MRSRKRMIAKVTGFCFILPAMLVVLLLLLYPVMSSIFYSFTNKNLIKPAYSFVGFENYAKILTDSGRGGIRGQKCPGGPVAD